MNLRGFELYRIESKIMVISIKNCSPSMIKNVHFTVQDVGCVIKLKIDTNMYETSFTFK
jgi:hypothetical protein